MWFLILFHDPLNDCQEIWILKFNGTFERGDELHYIFYCPYFATDRNKYVKQAFYVYAPAVNWRVYLINVSGPELIDACKFIKCILIEFQI